MSVWASGALWTKPKHVIHAYLLLVLLSMAIVASLTKLAEAPLVIWACLLLLRGSSLVRGRMPVDTPR